MPTARRRRRWSTRWCGISRPKRTTVSTRPLSTPLGKSSYLKAAYLPPDPPTGHGPHRYCFQIFALDIVPALEEGAGRGAVVEALKGHVLAKGMLVGTYERAG